MKLLIRPIVEDDLKDNACRIGADHPESAKRFLLRVAETFDLLARLPLLGAGQVITAHPAARLFSIRRFRNYVVLYLPLADGVEILRVLEGRRDLPTLFNRVD